MNINNIIDEFNNGDFESYYKIFDGYENFYKFLDKRNSLDKIDITSDNSSEFENSYLLYLLENKKELFYEIFEKYTIDFKLIDGIPYLELQSLSDLSKLFCDDKYGKTISGESIEDILSGEYHYDSYHSDISDNFYYDIIVYLTENNFNKLVKKVVRSLSSIEFGDETDLLSKLNSTGQLYPLNYDTISKLLKDEDTVNFIFKEYLSEMKYDLYGIYQDSYSLSYEYHVSELIWEELSRFVVNNPIWYDSPHPYKKNVKVQNVRIKIWNFESDIKHFLTEYIYGNNTVSYFGSYLSILEQLMNYSAGGSDYNCLTVYWPDYPSSIQIRENLNELISDFL